jgi:hypothetical protein
MDLSNRVEDNRSDGYLCELGFSMHIASCGFLDRLSGNYEKNRKG